MYMRSIGIRESDVVTELVQKYLYLFPDRETTHYLCNVQKCVFYEPGADDGGCCTMLVPFSKVCSRSPAISNVSNCSLAA